MVTSVAEIAIEAPAPSQMLRRSPPQRDSVSLTTYF